MVVCCNFTPVPRMAIASACRERCWYEEIFNSDSTFYGGSNVGNGAGVMAEDIPWHGRPFSAEIVLPPLSVTIFKPQR